LKLPAGQSAVPTPVEAAFVKYERAIKRVIGRITGSREDAEDLAQDVFLRVTAAERQTPIENAKAYLFEAARNAARTERCKQTRRVLDAIGDAITERRPDAELSAELVSVGQERLALFCEAVRQLPPQCQAVFVMCKVHGNSYREISSKLGISESTVEKHVGTGLARCAAYIRAHEQGEAERSIRSVDARRLR
jgi:RNA polymerase sigma factor (sigma-70 family)